MAEGYPLQLPGSLNQGPSRLPKRWPSFAGVGLYLVFLAGLAYLVAGLSVVSMILSRLGM